MEKCNFALVFETSKNMKRLNLIFLFLFIYIHFADGNHLAFIQEQPKSKLRNNQNTAPISSLSTNRVQKSSNQKVDKLAEKIILTLDLNEVEAKTIYHLCENRAEKIEKVKLNSDNSQQKISDLQAINDDFDFRIKQLVSPSQYHKYEALRKSGN
ncbi:MAG: hypothetical protein V4683_06160 [Bacteroidota bacterium]